MAEGLIEETDYSYKSLTLERSVASRGFWGNLWNDVKKGAKKIARNAAQGIKTKMSNTRISPQETP